MLLDVLLRTGRTSPLFAVVVAVVAVVLAGLSIAYEMTFYRSFGVGSESRSAESKINCPTRGARVPADSENCDYCGESIPQA